MVRKTGGTRTVPLANAQEAVSAGLDQRLKVLEAENARLHRLIQAMMRERRSLALVEETPLDFSAALLSLWRWSNRGCLQVAKLAGLKIEAAALNILEILAQHGPMRIVDLAARLELDGSTVSRQVAAAVASGYVVRTSRAGHTRETLLSASDSGMVVMQRLVEAWGQIGVRFMADWNREDQVRMVELLDKLAQRLDKDMGT